jgi:hypothetical protein
MNSIEQQCNPPLGEVGNFEKRWNDSDTHKCVEKIQTPIQDQES